MKAFEALHPSLQYHVVNTLGWPSLRPLQELALPALLAGEHALLLAPTAGGKTEAAVFPILSRMLSEDWRGLSVLYICPLRALLNNLHPRLERYANLLGRRVGLWHGDVSEAAKRSIRRSPPDLLLTTPESLEGLLVSSRLDPRAFFADLRAVVIDEIHAFAGDDRGWHLLAVLERLGRLASHGRIQRVGLSATVGNPATLLDWLVGRTGEPGQVLVDPGDGQRPTPAIEVDWVGHLANAAQVIATLHRGEKRLVFCDSRARTEELAHHLKVARINTFVSHSSLARDLRLHSEQTFTAASEGVIVATSTLELGIDIGDLDRVIQIDAPGQVASFLQRLGRTGRRPGTQANCLFLTTHPQAFLRAAAIVQLWSEGYVEPVTPPAEPFHVLTQQIMALCLQEHGLAPGTWRDPLLEMAGFADLGTANIEQLETFLHREGVLWNDGRLLWLGQEGERRYQRRNFMELLSMITDSPLFTVYHGHQELGQVDRASFLVRDERPPTLLLAGRSWKVETIDWRRKRCWVSLVEEHGRSRWLGEGQALSFDLCQAIRRLLSGQVTPPGLTRRAEAQLAIQRQEFPWLDNGTDCTVFEPLPDGRQRWWTFAGLLGNATLLGHLRPHLPQPPPYDNLSITLHAEDATTVRRLLAHGLDLESEAMPQVDKRAVESLKFNECLPRPLLRKVVQARWSDPRAVAWVAGARMVVPS